MLFQDICRAVTRGEWKLSKHILLRTTVRHLYRSKQLTTIRSRLGDCETYDFSLEPETALAKALDEVSTSLTPQIITGESNEVFHLEWDNMNKITTNIHGSNVVNSTGGIMIQEVKPGFGVSNKDRTLPIYKRSTTRSLKVDTPETLAPIHIYSRVKFIQSASKSIMSSHFHGKWGAVERSNFSQGLVASSQLLASSPLESQPLTISLPSTSPLQSSQ